MKAINLYNNIAGGTPAKIIKYKNHEFVYDEEVHDYYCKQFCDMGWLFDTLKDLNEEVEIIEEYKEEKPEDNKIKRIILITEDTNTFIKDHENEANYLLPETKIVIEKLNEVIERLNEVIENEEDSTND